MAPSKDLNAGMRCIKYILLSFNLLFVITGILLILVGAAVLSLYHDYIEFLDNRYLQPAILPIVIGAIIFFVAFFGCCGAYRESTCMVMLFAVMLGIIFILEIAAAIAGFVLQDGLRHMLMNSLNEAIDTYEKDPRTAETLDFVQTELYCCGLESPEDWQGKLWNSGLIFGDFTFPESCCADLEIHENGTSTCSYVYSVGCLYRLEILIGQSALVIASAAISIALFQLLGIVFACSLGRSIRAYKTDRERRRQELRERLLSDNSALRCSDPARTYPVIYMDTDKNDYGIE